MFGSIGKICGMKIIVQQPTMVKIKRTWKERLFSIPWEPLISHLIEYRDILKDGQVIQTPNSYIMNPKTYEKLKE